MDYRGFNRNNIPNYYQDVLLPILTSVDQRPIINFLIEKGLLKGLLHDCAHCHNSPLSLTKKSRLGDGYVW